MRRPEPPLGVTTPSAQEFQAAVGAGAPVVSVVRRLLADDVTPVALYRALAADTVGSYLLESAQVDGTWARYSFVGAAPQARLVERDGVGVWLGQPPQGLPAEGPLLDMIATALAAIGDAPIAGLPAGAHALVGTLSFDLIRQWERLEPRVQAAQTPPVIHLVLSRDMAIMDHRHGTVTLVCNVWNPPQGQAAQVAWQEAEARLDEMVRRIAQAQAPALASFDADAVPQLQLRTTRQEYLQQVRKTQQAIVDGEVFQAVIAQRFELECDADALDVYRVMRVTNPSPYMYLLRCQGAGGQRFDVVGSSPEALVKVSDGVVISHPIAGTRPRTGDDAVDAAAVATLVEDEKELAEHVMLVDLARNDLSRVCEPGSVTVPRFQAVQYFSHVIHLTSTVTGTLRAGLGPVDVLRATFPAGTLSGAPKIRAIQLIDELEPVRRGLYGGCVGYLDPGGDLDLAIAIRTAVITDGQAQVYAGAGIVADSDPQAEYNECRAKAAAALRSVAAAPSMSDAGR